MNCQDISRIADSGAFNNLSEAERRAAETHAFSCRHCAPVWAAHSRLAELRIPPMPAELLLQCQTLAALPARTGAGILRRRLSVVGSLVVLAAAAALLVMHLGSRRAPPSRPSAVAIVATNPVPAATRAEVATPTVSEAVVPVPAPVEVAKVQPDRSLPLLLPPDYSARDAAVDLALQKAADLHPELVEGPEIDGFFAAAIVMRANGVLVRSAVQPPIPATRDLDAQTLYLKARDELERTLPKEGSSTTVYRQKHTVLPDGRSLRADVRLQVAVILDNFDLTRSSERVLATVREKHSDLLLPATGAEINFLTIFLADDGSIQRELVERTNRQNRGLPPPPFPMRQDDPEMPARVALYVAQEIARRLSLDVDQIGLMNMTTLEEGKAIGITDGTGNLRLEDNRRVLNILYAWPRREGESAPVLGQFSKEGTGPTTLRPKFDETAAVVIIKREIPDAFTVKDKAAGMPGVVLNSKGEVLRAGRLRAPNGEQGDFMVLLRQLAPGVQLGTAMTQDIKDETGASVHVAFAWEAAPAAAK